MPSLPNPFPSQISDGVNSVVILPANTTPVGSNASLAVSLSPNSVLLPNAATASNQVSANTKLDTIISNQTNGTQHVVVDSPSLPTGAATETTLNNIKAILQQQLDITASIWTDNSGAFYYRREVYNPETSTYTITYTDPSGAPATPGVGLRPASGSNFSILDTSYKAIAGGTGYSNEDVLLHVAILNTGVTPPPVVGNIWINLSTGLVISTPTAGTYESVSESAINDIQIAVGTKSDAAATDSTSDWSSIALLKGLFGGVNSKIPTLGQKIMDGSVPVVLASDTVIPLPTGASTDATFTSRINTLGQKLMTASTPVVLSSDQSAIPVTQSSGPWTQNLTQLSGTAVTTGTGSATAGTLRVITSTDSAIKLTDGTNNATVKAASTAALATDTAVVVQISPNSPALSVATIASATTNRSGTITTGGVSQQLAAANATRKRLLVQNGSTATESIFINWGAAATTTPGGGSYEILPGGVYDSAGATVANEAVNIIAATTAHAFTAKEW